MGGFILKNDNGFTTIELILAIAIAGIIMGAVGTFLTFNLRGFNITKDIIDIQYEAQLAMNQMTNIAQESTGIMVIEDSSGTDLSLTTTPVSPDEIVFYNFYEDTGVERQTTYTLTYDVSSPTNKKIYIDTTYHDGSTDPQYILAQYLTEFTITPSDGQNFSSTKGMTIYMAFRDGDAVMDLKTEVKFRNKH